MNYQHAVCRKGQALNELAAAVKRDIDEAESQAIKGGRKVRK